MDTTIPRWFPVNWCSVTMTLLIICLQSCHKAAGQQYSSPGRDNFHSISEHMNKVTPENCAVLDTNSLFLPMQAVSHLPDIKQFGIDPIYENRTNLQQVHNMALYKAFFSSFILQKAQDEHEPGFMYWMLSVIADVSSNPHVNSSGVYFSPNRAFTPSYDGFFNKTLPLFAPRAVRADDFNDPTQLRGTSTLNTISASDLGAIRSDSRDSNYTTPEYKTNEWYQHWLPDLTRRHDSKPTYSVQISHANGTNETFVFHGPPGASDDIGPVKWTRPYYDCGRSNKWLLAATVPIADLYPRHTGWRHIELPLYVAVSVIEMDFNKLDINQCPLSDGNVSPNIFADTSKCRKDTSTCEPIHGYGLRRGGYQCRCKPGYRLPRYVKGPYIGEIVERASETERKQGFSCKKIDNLAVKTQNVQPLPSWDRDKVIAQMETLIGLSSNFSGQRSDANLLSEQIRKSIPREDCNRIRTLAPHRLKLPGNFAHGKEQQFENQARAALRLSHFISSFIQLIDPRELFAEFRKPDKPLTKDQIMGEVLSSLASDRQIQGIGVFFDRNKFNSESSSPTEYFAPYAYRLERNARNFYIQDMAAKSPSDKNHYTTSDTFSKLKTRWKTTTDTLDTFTLKMNIRFNSSGLNSIRYDRYPLQYRSAQLEHGYWTAPFYDCNGLHNTWLISYASPFFGWDKLKLRIEFRGIVIVNLKLSELDINQCDDEYYVNNAFKDTHKCDRRSTRCVPISGRKYEAGGYKCECKQGYEYPFNDLTTYFDGQMMEAEYLNVLQNKPSRFDSLTCRLAS